MTILTSVISGDLKPLLFLGFETPTIPEVQTPTILRGFKPLLFLGVSNLPLHFQQCNVIY